MGGKEAGKAIKQVIYNQIKQNNPPITKITYNRLMKLINDKEEVIRMLAAALSSEIFYMMKGKESFNLKRYSNILENLPDESYLED